MLHRSLLEAAQFVQDILARWPWTAQAFIDLRTACVGCQMARFCTLDDVATHYRLDKERLLRALLQPPSPVRDAGGDTENADASNSDS